MSTSIIQFRIEDDLKEQACAIFEKLGIDLSTALRMFIKRAILENGIPFPMTFQSNYDSTSILNAVKGMTNDASKNGNSDMTLDEINAEISEYRQERKRG